MVCISSLYSHKILSLRDKVIQLPYHLCKGEKIWLVRSFEEHRDWLGNPPVISSSTNSGGIPSIKRIRAGSSSRLNKRDGILRIRIVCKEGDLLFVNTRLWWHQTFLPRSDDMKDGLSISYARDFEAPMLALERSSYYKTPTKTDDNKEGVDEDERKEEEEKNSSLVTNVEGVYASRNVSKGNIVLQQSELPDCSLPESHDYNCEVCELEDGLLALVAVKDITAGDWLTVAYSSDESSDDDHDDGFDIFSNDEYAGLYGEDDVSSSQNDNDSTEEDEIDALSVD